MAEKLKDAEDRLLESMLQSDSIADDGFSQRVVAQIRRRQWVQRLSLPIAVLIGGAIALKPAMQVMTVVTKLLDAVPQEVLDAPTSWLPQVQANAYGTSFAQMLVIGAMLVASAVLANHLLQE